ncbi:hypothetical protein EDC96DRAFT_501141 [Choanephora cucurbitarum]|nr:hypothetical protein EDC96DRAFT_501141 [Choanephora cucurbitarum]
MTIPTYDQLPIHPKHPKGTAWGVWGEDDNIGTANLLTPERVVNAAQYIKTGKRFPLNWGLEHPRVALFGRQKFKHNIIEKMNGLHFDDSLDGFNLQTSSQWDGLRHFSFVPSRQFYNGVKVDQIRLNTPLSDDRLGMHHMAQKGLAGRAVLLDFHRWAAQHRPDFDPFQRHEITVEELEQVAAYQQVQFELGDILLIRTGWTARYEQGGPEVEALAGDHWPLCAGIQAGEKTYRWIWDHQFSAIATDAIPVEALPFDVEDCCHSVLNGGFGMMLGEMFYLEDLAQDSVEDKVYTYFFTSAPLNLKNGIASPPNAMCIK